MRTPRSAHAQWWIIDSFPATTDVKREIASHSITTRQKRIVLNGGNRYIIIVDRINSEPPSSTRFCVTDIISWWTMTKQIIDCGYRSFICHSTVICCNLSQRRSNRLAYIITFYTYNLYLYTFYTRIYNYVFILADGLATDLLLYCLMCSLTQTYYDAVFKISDTADFTPSTLLTER